MKQLDIIIKVFNGIFDGLFTEIYYNMFEIFINGLILKERFAKQLDGY